MGESSSNRAAPPPSRFGPRSEIVEVQGGHIVRSTGRKDRHSKVCTAKGPRDRRVRLAAHTAIQFYDVQDRLGYDRPSKAVDWLIKKAKAAIDELAQLPPWHPTLQNMNFVQDEDQRNREEEEEQQEHQENLSVHHGEPIISGASSKRPMMMVGGEDELRNNPSSQNSSFLPSSLGSDSIADTIKSFFPMGASAEASSSSVQFQSFQGSDLLSRNGGNIQDLRLSLQSFQDPMLLHHQASEQAHQQGQSLLNFDGTPNWTEHHQHAMAAELNRFQRLTAWNPSGGGDSDNGNGGAAASFLFNSQQPTLQQLLGHAHFSSQRGPLQSSNTPSIRAWMDPSAIVASNPIQLQLQHHQLLPTVVPIYPSSMQGIGFSSGAGGFSAFSIPARIQGDLEEHDGYSDKPASVSSDSHH